MSVSSLPKFRIDWMKAAADHDKDQILECVARIDFGHANPGRFDEWIPLPAENVPMSQGMGIESMIEQLRLPRASQICYSSDFAPYSLLGVRCSYRISGQPDREKRHTVDCFAMDYGSHIAVICARVWESEVTCDQN